MILWQVADELARRVCNIFLRNRDQQRPVYEYFHGDNGASMTQWR
jgi:hypothetical protein